jgi:hypothetical protein
VCVVFGDPFPKDAITALKQRGREGELVEAVRDRIAECQKSAEDWLRQSSAV